METVLLICVLLVFYTYIGYPLLIWMVSLIKKTSRRTADVPGMISPSITLIIPAYNEAGCIEQKIINTISLDYPGHQLSVIIVTDGSVDETPQIVSRYPQLQLLHDAERKGKAQAIEHAMKHVQSELVVFTDANTLLNPEALRKLARHFADPGIGGVAGEKRVSRTERQSTGGEGWYWYYESRLKKFESDFYSVMGAAGELFCIRTALYEPVAPDTVVDDLAISLQVSLKGYRIAYEPDAFATEPSSQNSKQELERKIRIAAGGIQSLTRYTGTLLLKHPLLAFEYISHRVLRWVIVPYLLILSFLTALAWIILFGFTGWVAWLFVLQIFFYLMALAGGLIGQKGDKGGWFFAPFYFCLIHYAMIAGLIRYCNGKQSVLWQKADR